jgi:NAD-dependent DNA ligase
VSVPEKQLVVVFTGIRDKALEAQLEAAGHIVADGVSKKTTHVVYPDGPVPTSSKITKAQELGISIQPLSIFKSNLEV